MQVYQNTCLIIGQLLIQLGNFVQLPHVDGVQMSRVLVPEHMALPSEANLRRRRVRYGQVVQLVHAHPRPVERKSPICSGYGNSRGCG